jgi:hypothetical protein
VLTKCYICGEWYNSPLEIHSCPIRTIKPPLITFKPENYNITPKPTRYTEPNLLDLCGGHQVIEDRRRWVQPNPFGIIDRPNLNMPISPSNCFPPPPILPSHGPIAPMGF